MTTREDHLRATLRSFGPLSEADIEAIAPRVKRISIAKGEIVQTIGERGDQAFFVITGGLRTFHYDAHGRQATRSIILVGAVCTVFESFIGGTPSTESIEAFTPTEAYLWTKREHDHWQRSIPAWSQVYIGMLERALAHERWRLLGLLGMNGAERYEALAGKWPKVIEQAPDKVISTYLGLAPEYLSKLKAKRAKRT